LFNIQQEFRFITPSGFKGSRFADVAAVNPATGQPDFFQIGKMTKTKGPVMRERKAILDILFKSEGPGRFTADDALFFVDNATGKIVGKGPF
jgi:hypothetical protein